MEFIEDMCRRATKTAVIGSLAVLDYINNEFDQNMNLDLFDTYLNGTIEDQFKGASVGRNKDFTSNLTDSFRALLNESGTERASREYLNNAFNCLHQRYYDCFFRNIKIHGKNRVKKLFVLWHIEATSRKPNKDESKVIRTTADFIFNEKCTANRNDVLVDRFMQYLPVNMARLNVNSDKAGFMQKMLWKDNWHRMVPLYLKIQRDIDVYHQACRFHNVKTKLSNFAVVPLHCNLMKHIQIDSATFKHIISHLKLWPADLKKELFKKTDTDHQLWMTFFNEKVIKRMERRDRKKFKYSFATDSESVSLQFETENVAPPNTVEELEAKQKANFKLYGERYKGNEYERIIGLDPGYKLFLSGVVRDDLRNEERLIKISSRKYHNMTQQNIRDRRAKTWTANFEANCRTEREQYFEQTGQPLSPVSSTYTDYILHRLTHLDDALAVYTTKKYTRLAFCKYTRAQSTMDTIVNDMVVLPKTGKRNLIILGGTEFHASSPIKKYRRCPGIRKLITTIKKRTNCDAISVDEYNTSQVCARCFGFFKSSEFEKQRHKKWEWKGHRMRNCSDCKPNETYMPLPRFIETKASPKEIQMDVLKRTQRTYAKYNTIVADEAAEYEKGFMLQYGDLTYRRSITKQLQANYNSDREKPLKCVWNRDVVAGRNIMVKGICIIQNIQPPQSLRRPKQRDRNDNDSDCD